jgi:parallel beta-helix repeat protein
MIKYTNATKTFLIVILAITALLAVVPTHAQTVLTFDVWREGTTTTYHAVSQTTPSSYTGALKFVVESAVSELVSSGGGNILFAAGDFDLGSSFFKFYDPTDVVFAGQGIDVTVVRNWSDAAADTEPFNCSNCDRLTIRDMTILAGGPIRSTSDAIDLDDGDDNLIERVKVTSARGRAIVFDGKGPGGGHANGNIIRDCVITGTIPYDGIQMLASSNNRVEGCHITDVSRYGIYANKASSSAAQPNKPSDDNIISGNLVERAGSNGIAVNGSNRNVITGNTVLNSTNSGILITTGSSLPCNDNVVAFNTATANQIYGLNITSAACNRTVVQDNNFSGNGVGAIRDLGTNTIYVQSGTPTSTPITPPTSTGTLTPTFTPTSTSTPVGSGSLTLTAVADSYVNESNPGGNYGTSTSLRTDNSPIQRTYLRFQVPTLSGGVISATLRVYANSNNNTGYTVHETSGGWGETTISFSNAPTFGSSLGSSGAVSANSWTQVDVTTLVTGAGEYNFVMASASNTATSFSSRTGANPPQLIVNVAGGSGQASQTVEGVSDPLPVSVETPTLAPSETPTPTETVTETPTVVPSETPTPTLTETPTPALSETPTLTATLTETPTVAPNETSIPSVTVTE